MELSTSKYTLNGVFGLEIKCSRLNQSGDLYIEEVAYKGRKLAVKNPYIIGDKRLTDYICENFNVRHIEQDMTGWY